MKKILSLFLFLLASVSLIAQSPYLNDVVRANTLSPARVANALDALKPYSATGTDTYAVSILPTVLYSGVATYVDGDLFAINFTNANTSTTVTVNINSEGAQAVKDNEGNDPAIGAIKAGGTYFIKYNGTNFRLLNLGGGGGGNSYTMNVLNDSSIIDVSEAMNSFTTSSASRDFTISWAGNYSSIIVTLNTTSSIFTFPVGALCVSEGIPTGNNTAELAGVYGDKYEISIKNNTGGEYTIMVKNVSQ